MMVGSNAIEGGSLQDFDKGFKEVAQSAGRELARITDVECDRLTPIGGEVQATTERLADRAFVARRGRERFVVYFEAYARWDRHAPLNLLAKSGLLAERERLPVLPIVYILRRRGYRSQDGRLALQVGGVVTQLLQFREVPFWEVEPQPWWENAPTLMSLYPLCRHGRQPRDLVAHATEVIVHQMIGDMQRADALSLLDLFGEMAYPGLDVEAIIGREKMGGSKFGRSMECEGIRKAIVRILRTRFGLEPLSATEADLADVNTQELLDALVERAVSCGSLAEFRAGLPTLSSQR